MPSGVYERTPAMRKSISAARRKSKALKANGSEDEKDLDNAISLALTATRRKSLADAKANGSEEATSRRRAVADLAAYTAARLAEAVERNDFSLARAWMDLSESISKSE